MKIIDLSQKYFFLISVDIVLSIFLWTKYFIKQNKES